MVLVVKTVSAITPTLAWTSKHKTIWMDGYMYGWIHEERMDRNIVKNCQVIVVKLLDIVVKCILETSSSFKKYFANV